MNQTRRRRRRAAREITLLEQRDLQSTASGITRDAGADDAATDDRKIKLCLSHARSVSHDGRL
jgi:hypothetical protein